MIWALSVVQSSWSRLALLSTDLGFRGIVLFTLAVLFALSGFISMKQRSLVRWIYSDLCTYKASDVIDFTALGLISSVTITTAWSCSDWNIHKES